MALARLTAAALVAVAPADLTLRAREPAPEGSVREVSIDGVVVASEVTAPVIVGWDRVWSVEGEHADEASAFLEIADLAWRARTRLERGDVPAAEPLFERLFVTYEGRRGPTAAVVCEGLLRCRLRRNAHTLAVGAWLSWLHARTPGEGPQWYQRRSPTGADASALPLDEPTGLIPDLPPIWVDLPAVRAFATGPASSEGLGEREHDLAALYRYAAAMTAGVDASLPDLGSRDGAVRLVWDVVAAQSEREEERAAGRRGIDARLRADPRGWEEAWLRTALGRSLLVDLDPEQRRRGVIELLRVRVGHEHDAPYLAGLALAEAAVALVEAGDLAGGTRLRREFLDRFPGHPAASWDRIVLWPEDGAGSPSARGPASESGGFLDKGRALHG